jgi:carbon-monoxide dehydrogenase large subunit
VRRRGELPLLRGEAAFVGDIELPGTVHVAFVRSPHAHAKVLAVAVARARAHPGVVDAVSAADFDPLPGPLPVRVGPHPRFDPFLRSSLATDRVRHVGEVVAAVVADSRYVAEDAAELVDVEWDPLAAVVDPLAAAGPEAPLLFPAAGTNVALVAETAHGDVGAAFRQAAVVVSERFTVNRHTGVPLETRGLLAAYEDGVLTVWGPTKAIHAHRLMLHRLLGLPLERIRLVEPSVGGGFGVRGETHPEDVLVPALAMRLGRPVKWIEDRREHLVATNHSREQVHDAELAVAADGRILGIRTTCVVDTGAYVGSLGVRIGEMTAHSLCGPYRVPTHATTVRTVVTNKTPVGTYRAPGRFEANFVRERLLDLAARKLGLDPVELRRRNLIAPGEMPYEPGMLDAGEPIVYETGDCGRMLELALEAVGYDELRAGGRAARPGRRLGIGVACFMEDGGLGGLGHTPGEYARVALDVDGAVTVYSGVAELGQGFETMLAQICADELGVGLERVGVVHGDTGLVESGGGTWASRGAILAGNATLLAARQVREQLEAGAVAPLEGSCTFSMPRITYSPGAAVAVVEVDCETGEVEVVRHALAYDVGRAVNPVLVQGQIHGGVAQGLGGALLEDLPYDENGQPLATTLADYLLPSATDLPHDQRVVVEESGAGAGNPLGVKAVGEVGPGGAGPAIANAVADVLEGLGATVRSLPLSPDRVLALLRESAS